MLAMALLLHGGLRNYDIEETQFINTRIRRQQA
jgi:hypothetical protein